jgi:hypothetical protein
MDVEPTELRTQFVLASPGRSGPIQVLPWGYSTVENVNEVLMQVGAGSGKEGDYLYNDGFVLLVAEDGEPSASLTFWSAGVSNPGGSYYGRDFRLVNSRLGPQRENVIRGTKIHKRGKSGSLSSGTMILIGIGALILLWWVMNNGGGKERSRR